RYLKDFKGLPNVDAVINLAANPGIPWSIENPIYDASTNLMGALNVLEFARNCGACVIHASTNKVYSNEINSILFKRCGNRYELSKIYANGINERFPVDGAGEPHSPYGCSKLAADIYAQEYNTTYNVPTVVCRMSAIYGPRQMSVSEQGWVVWFMYCKKYNIPLEIFGDGLQVRDLLYIDDLCRLYYLLITDMSKYRGGVFNIGGGPHNTLSVLELINWLNRKGGSKLELTYKDWRIADHKVYVSDIRKVRDTVGWFPITGVEEGLQKTWEWVNR
ncbi:MAG: NAD-dependent epimerase/dehydratase family protein, partial [Bacteroidetes bacterium]|nr:NAD-dependent epimerase/dehydratase family protein [Bacteroidota bacterium]